MFKFTIREIVLLTTTIAALLGWYLDTRYLVESTGRLRFQVEVLTRRLEENGFVATLGTDSSPNTVSVDPKPLRVPNSN
jgi:hypothetical protein